jgi:hypothetical protein
MNNPLRILDETRIDVDGVRELLGTGKTPASLATALRAMKRGYKTPDGGRVVLEHLHVGCKIVSSREAVARFLAAANGLSPEGPEPERGATLSGKRRQEHLARTVQECEAIGM